jgi:hypothetical protein
VSYARFSGDSDVYMYESVTGGIVCCACQIRKADFPSYSTRSKAIKHLHNHIKAGYKVPQYAIDRLLEEIEEEGDEV